MAKRKPKPDDADAVEFELTESPPTPLFTAEETAELEAIRHRTAECRKEVYGGIVQLPHRYNSADLADAEYLLGLLDKVLKS